MQSNSGRHAARTMTSGPERPMISVVIPTLNEASCLGACLRSIRDELPGAEVLVVDGGSVDGTAAIAAASGVRVLYAPHGRGIQCNVGGSHAAGAIVMFLHADTTLPVGAESLIIERFRRPGVDVATFRLSFDDEHPLLRFSAFFTRFDSRWSKFGDQVIMMRKEVFLRAGGFRAWPFLEDVEILRRLRAETRIHVLSAAVRTSARRFQADGYYRRQLRSAWILIRFFLGVSPHVLAREYPSSSPRVRCACTGASPGPDQPGVILTHSFSSHGNQRS